MVGSISVTAQMTSTSPLVNPGDTHMKIHIPFTIMQYHIIARCTEKTRPLWLQCLIYVVYCLCSIVCSHVLYWVFDDGNRLSHRVPELIIASPRHGHYAYISLANVSMIECLHVKRRMKVLLIHYAATTRRGGFSGKCSLEIVLSWIACISYG